MFLERWSRIFLPLAAGFLIIVSAVTFRNWFVAKDFVLLSAHSGINFYIGNGPYSSGVFQNPIFLPPTHEGHAQGQKIIAELTLQRNLKPSQVSSFWMDKTLRFIQSSPGEYMRLLRNKFLMFFTRIDDADDIDLSLQRDWREALDFNSFSIISPLAILGLALTLKKYPQMAFVNLIILSQFIFTVIFFLISRHRVTVVPFLMMYEAFTIFWLIERIQKRRFIPVVVSGILCFVLFMFLKPVVIGQRVIDFTRLMKSGFIFSQSGDSLRARDQYQKALELQPFDVDALYNLGNCYAEEKNFPEAIRYYQKVLAIRSYDTDALFNLARVYELANTPAQAIETYQQLLLVKPSEYNAHLKLAAIYRSQKNCKQAIIHYEQAVKINPLLAQEVKRAIDECTK